MRIALVIVSKGYGGLERHVIDLANELAKAHTVCVFGDASFREKLDPSIQLRELAATTWRFNLLALWQLRRDLDAFAPDVIHAQANKAAFMTNLCGTTAPARIATLHNVKHHTEPFTAFDGVIAVSHPAQQRLKHAQSLVVENGIAPIRTLSDTQRSVLKARWCTPDEPLTLAVGRLVEAKGFDNLISAWRDLPGKLVIVGTGKEEESLKRQAAQQGLGKRVIFVGFRADVPELMQAADLLAMSSRREGFPYVLVEALHAGVPIIATDIPGAREFLPREAVVPCDDTNALHNALQWALNQWPDLRARYEPYCTRARHELTLAQMTAKTVAFYEQILQSKRP
ncbi:glycosyltransferase [Halothiobacillus sp.]|uniref:glycosyltransferase n=1 Tax=Halothiobacillus sp. TaxID=1891311 RepID=UPI002621C802|nr:glycosyltransferase [Halothiobacillus sp.]